MRLRMSRDELLDRISQIVEPTISFRRFSEASNRDEDTPALDTLEAPIRPDELELFILQCPFSNPDIANDLLADDADGSISEFSFRAEELAELLADIETWARNDTWLAADDWPLVVQGSTPGFVLNYEDYVEHISRERYSRESLTKPSTLQSIMLCAPSIGILQHLRDDKVALDSLSWRDFEKLVAELLAADGYDIELQRGSKDGGVDIVAVREIVGVGRIKCVWQAKHHRLNNKVGLHVVRELADVREEHKANKGMIVTSSYLTRGALERIRRDTYLLGKVDRDELNKWIDRVLFGR